MRVLVTRPEPAAANTARKLRDLGHEPIVLALMAARHRPQTVRSALACPHPAIAVTSAEAIRMLGELDVSLEAHRDTTLFCVGAATAKTAAHLGFRRIVTGPGTGDGLASAIIAAGIGREGPLLYLAGRPRSPDFETRLRQAGVAVTTVESYGMEPIDYPPDYIAGLLSSRNPEIALFYSAETAALFFRVVSPALLLCMAPRFRIACLSPRIAQAVPPLDAPILVAEHPDEESLFRLL